MEEYLSFWYIETYEAAILIYRNCPLQILNEMHSKL